jgi:hypothetical protein
MSYDVTRFKQVCLEARVKYKGIRYGMPAAGIPDLVVIGVGGQELQLPAREFDADVLSRSLTTHRSRLEQDAERTQINQLRADVRRAVRHGCSGHCALPLAVVLGVILDTAALR